MAVAYQSDGGGVFCAANNNNAVTVPLPATRPVGSVLLLVAFCQLITATVGTAPSGYTLLGTWTSGTASGGRIWLYGRICDGTESAPTFAVSNAVTGNSGDVWAAGITCYSGVDTSGGISAIFDGTATTTDASGTTTCTYPALTIAQTDSMIVRMLARFRDAVDTFTPTATWNERADLGSTNRLGGQFHAQDKLATASGAQASVTVAPSNTTAARYLAVTFALKAALFQSYTGQAALALGLGTAANGVREVKGAATFSINLAEPAQGQRETYSQAVVFVDLGLAGSGLPQVISAGQGKVGTFKVGDPPPILFDTWNSAAMLALSFGTAGVGTRDAVTQAAFPLGLSLAVQGVIAPIHLGQAALPLGLDVAVQGVAVSGVLLPLPLALGLSAQGVVERKAQAVLPLSLGVAAQGVVPPNWLGQAAMPLGLGVAAQGARGQTAQAALALNLGLAAQGVSARFGQALLQLGLDLSTRGALSARGRAVLLLVLDLHAKGHGILPFYPVDPNDGVPLVPVPAGDLVPALVAGTDVLTGVGAGTDTKLLVPVSPDDTVTVGPGGQDDYS